MFVESATKGAHNPLNPDQHEVLTEFKMSTQASSQSAVATSASNCSSVARSSVIVWRLVLEEMLTGLRSIPTSWVSDFSLLCAVSPSGGVVAGRLVGFAVVLSVMKCVGGDIATYNAPCPPFCEIGCKKGCNGRLESWECGEARIRRCDETIHCVGGESAEIVNVIGRRALPLSFTSLPRGEEVNHVRQDAASKRRLDPSPKPASDV